MNSLLRDQRLTHLTVELMIKKLKGISTSLSKHGKFEEYKKCLEGGNYQKECDSLIFRSLNHELYLQRIPKNTLTVFDDERC